MKKSRDNKDLKPTPKAKQKLMDLDEKLMDTQNNSEMELSKPYKNTGNDSPLPKGAQIVVESRQPDAKSVQTPPIPMLNYRDLELKVIDFITMRSLIHQKIH